MKLPSIIFGFFFLFFLNSVFAQQNTVIQNSHINGSAVIQGNGSRVVISGSTSTGSRQTAIVTNGTAINVDGDSSVYIHGNPRHDYRYERPYNNHTQPHMNVYVNSRTVRFIDIVDTSRNVTCRYDVYQQAVKYCW